MAEGSDTSPKLGVFKFFLIILSHLLLIFVDGRRVEFLKNKELFKHEGTVKTIESEDGDVIDCVDIKKQPAFNHPLLKNHTIQMKPNMHLRGIEAENNDKIFFQNWIKNGQCLEGTIPIIRTPEYVHRHRSYPPAVLQTKQLTNSVKFNPPPDHEYAQVSLVGGNYYGARAAINVWNPKTNNGELSIAQIWVLSGRENDLNSIEAGWNVYFGEKKTRFFIYWTSDGYKSTGCSNLLCPGFVQTNKMIALGAAIEPLSTYNGKQFEIGITIHKDKESGNWWLQVQNQMVGYWPGSIFTTLAESSTEINWGGEITNELHEGHHTSTQMGSGHFPSEGYGKASYFWNLGYIDDSGTVRDPENLIPYATKSSCYDLHIANNKDHGVHFYFGGAGYSNNCQ